MKLAVGTAKTDITPPIGTIMGAFPVQRDPVIPRRAARVHDPLHARAVALREGTTELVICSVDLVGVRSVVVDRVRREVQRRRPRLSPECVWINASHTHAGPEMSFLHGGRPDLPYVEVLQRQMADTIDQAYDAMAPARLSWGRANLELNHNRRVPNGNGKMGMAKEFDPARCNGPVDHDLHLLRCDREDGTPVSLLYHYTAHALTFGPKNDGFSADYPGIASSLLEKAFPRATAHFLNGAAGNIHPHECMRSDGVARDRVGRCLAQAVRELADSELTPLQGRLAVRHDAIEFANRMDPARSVRVECHVLGIGGFRLGTVPGEFFVEHQLAFKAAVAPHPGTLLGYANGGPGYVPNEASYDEGGYGVDAADRDPAEYSRTALPPGAGETVIRRLVEMSHDLDRIEGA